MCARMSKGISLQAQYSSYTYRLPISDVLLSGALLCPNSLCISFWKISATAQELSLMHLKISTHNMCPIEAVIYPPPTHLFNHPPESSVLLFHIYLDVVGVRVLSVYFCFFFYLSLYLLLNIMFSFECQKISIPPASPLNYCYKLPCNFDMMYPFRPPAVILFCIPFSHSYTYLVSHF